MRTHTQLKIFFARVLIALATLTIVTAPQQVMGAGQSKSAVVVALPQGARESAQTLHPTMPGVDRAGRFPVGRPQTKQDDTVSMDSNPFLFLAPVTYDPGGNAVSVVVADVNRDGKPDLVVVQDNSPNSIGILLGNGDGTFQSPVSYDSGGNFAAVAVADVNRDGKPDLVIANGCGDVNCSTEGSVGVLLGNGDGTFQPVVTYPGFGGRQLAVGDFNGDGNPDLVVVNPFSSNSISVLIGNGDGTSQGPVTYDPGGDDTDGVTIADVNRDGRADLIVANGGGTIGVLLGNGDGTFQPAVTYSSGGRGFPETDSPVVADLNGDGKPDLIVGNWASGTVGVLLGNGNGTFQPVVTYSGVSEPETVAVADVNGDGVPDVLMVGANSGVGVLLGNGNGTFQPLKFQLVEGAQSLGVADLNGDRKPDLAVAMNAVGAMLNNSGAPPTTTSLVSSANPAAINWVITYTATVTSQSGGVLKGTVVFYDQGAFSVNPFTTVTLAGNQAKLSATYPLAGSHPITATYSGDLKKAAGSTSPLLTETVLKPRPTNTQAITSASPSFVGQPVTITATVTSSYGTIPDGELVRFYDGPTLLGSVALAHGAAAYTTSSLSAKTHTIKATYVGDAQFAPSTGQVTQVVNGYLTSTSLTSSLNPSTYGQKVTWTATVTSSASIPPTGTVTLSWSNHTIGLATLNSSGVATFSRSKLNADSYPLTAVYGGDATHTGSTSAVLNQVVVQTTSTATLTSSPNPSAQSQAVTFTAKISSPTVTPTGPVTFTAGKTVLGTAQLSGGKATLTISSLAVGSTKVTATYYGDSNIAKSSASVIQTVQ